jgi:phage/plasmid-associated DNA primase
MHFINGVYNLRTGKFYPKESGKHYITYCIEHAYKKPTQKSMDKVRKLVKKIYPIEDDLQSILMLLRAALTGRFTRIQEALFLLGEGSTGKSTIMIITQNSIGCYVQELKDDTFSLNNNKRDKIYNT